MKLCSLLVFILGETSVQVGWYVTFHFVYGAKFVVTEYRRAFVWLALEGLGYGFAPWVTADGRSHGRVLWVTTHNKLAKGDYPRGRRLRELGAAAQVLEYACGPSCIVWVDECGMWMRSRFTKYSNLSSMPARSPGECWPLLGRWQGCAALARLRCAGKVALRSSTT